jgi:CubicO group peptidase (beta-lactamase class C family)
MTIRQLLTHTAGLAQGTSMDSPVDGIYRDRDIRNRDITLDDMIKMLKDIPLRHQPGTKWRYSIATDVVGRLVEIISGMPFDEYLSERIFGPLGMVDTAFWVPEDKLDRFPKVYEPGGNGSTIKEITRPDVSRYTRPVRFFSGAGGLTGTASDYMRFCQMLLNKGELDGVRLLGRKTVELMTQNHLQPSLMPFAISEGRETAHQGCGFGLGFAVVMDPAQNGVLTSEGEYSWGGAASTAFWIDPKEELIAILMTQFMPSSTYPIRREYRVLAYQALVD